MIHVILLEELGEKQERTSLKLFDYANVALTSLEWLPQKPISSAVWFSLALMNLLVAFSYSIAKGLNDFYDVAYLKKTEYYKGKKVLNWLSGAY